MNARFRQDGENGVPNRPLPHNIEAEQCLLGAILNNNEAYSLVSRLNGFEGLRTSRRRVGALPDDRRRRQTLDFEMGAFVENLKLGIA